MGRSKGVLIESFTIGGKVPVKAGAIPGGDDGQSSQNRKHEFKARDVSMTTPTKPPQLRANRGGLCILAHKFYFFFFRDLPALERDAAMACF